MMKRALTGIASVGILAVTVGVETANAQSYRRYGPARTYTPQGYPSQSRGSVPRGIPRNVPFSDPTVRKPPEVVASDTIEASRTTNELRRHPRRTETPRIWRTVTFCRTRFPAR